MMEMVGRENLTQLKEPSGGREPCVRPNQRVCAVSFFFFSGYFVCFFFLGGGDVFCHRCRVF